ncbi:MAG: SDR family NAD(P)-dependent oxidoreductase [Bacteroidia bacterium]
MKTILITGASSGIGLASAEYFAKKNWKVFASMRNTKDFVNNYIKNIVLIELDVSNKESIKNGVSFVLKKTDKLDVVLNNAGFGAYGAFELSKPEERQKMYDVNVFGVMDVIQTVLPHFRANKSGLIINVSSIGGLMTYPLYSVYHSTKWAIEGFSESLNYELKQFNISAKLIEPGVSKTNFVKGAQMMFKSSSNTDYDVYMNKLYSKVNEALARAITAEKVAETIFEAATDNREKLRYPVGSKQSLLLLKLRQILPLKLFIKLIRNQIEK